MAGDDRQGASRPRLNRIRGQLLRQAHLFDNPDAYVARVLDALDALTVEEGQDVQQHPGGRAGHTDDAVRR